MSRRRKSGSGAPVRRVNSRDTATNPLPSRIPSRRLWILLLVVALLAIAALLSVYRPWSRRTSSDTGVDMGVSLPLPPPTVRFASTTVRAGDFAGSEACAKCHRSEYEKWRASTHGTAGGAPSPATVIAPFNGRSIRFHDAEVIPTSLGGRYRFVVRQEGRSERVFTVDGVIGRGHMQGGGTQGFVSKFDDGTYRFLPFDFIRAEGRWFCNTEARGAKGWQPIVPSMSLAECGDWPPARVLGDEVRHTNCQSCHGSQIVVTLDTAAARLGTGITSLAINCESCHGPGRRHIALVTDPTAIAAGETGMATLATAGKDASLGVCWSCHALKDRLRGGYIAGESLEDYYALRTPQLGEQAHQADGRVRTFAYQQGHLWSDCYVNGAMTCTSCHDPHSQGYRDVNGTPLPGRVDDRQCTACHQAKGAAPTLHTHHADTSAGSRCVSCHMPYLQEPEVGTTLRYSRSDHAIPIPRPAADSASGVTSACRSCHADRRESVLDAQVAKWYGALKPVAPGIAAVQRLSSVTDRTEAATLVLQPGERHTAALFTGMALFADRFLTPDDIDLEADVIDRLDSLSAHADVDVRSLALAALHLAAGNRKDVRVRLAARLRALGGDEPRVRARWTLILSYFADKARNVGDAASAAATYRKALEIEPDNARLHLNLGVTLSQGGDYVAAAASIRRSLALDAAQPLALVNLGIALSSQGDRPGAIAAYRHALQLNSHEPLAWFNLGNALFQQGQAREAATAYGKAVDADPSLPVAHFYYARVLANLGDLKGALREVNAGLEFAPGDADALAARAKLLEVMGARGAS